MNVMLAKVALSAEMAGRERIWHVTGDDGATTLCGADADSATLTVEDFDGESNGCKVCEARLRPALVNVLLPVAPLFAFIDREYGSRKSFIQTVGERYGKDRYFAVDRSLTRIKSLGYITMAQADEWACDIFGVHPLQIWGNEWFEAEVREPRPYKREAVAA